MHTKYEEAEGPCVLWFAGAAATPDVPPGVSPPREVFFYVTINPGEEQCTAATNVRLPRNHAELPAWVLPLLQDLVGPDSGDDEGLQRLLDDYLALFGRDTEPLSHRVLRRINWASLPLDWQPLYLKNYPLRISKRETSLAQQRLIANALRGPEEEAQAANIVAALADITGL